MRKLGGNDTMRGFPVRGRGKKRKKEVYIYWESALDDRRRKWSFGQSKYRASFVAMKESHAQHVNKETRIFLSSSEEGESLFRGERGLSDGEERLMPR